MLLKESHIALLSLAAIVISLGLRFAQAPALTYEFPLLVALVLGGIPLLFDLIKKALNKEFGSDLLAGMSIVCACILGEYMAGTLVVLMLSGGNALERYAVRKASSVLNALARRMPSVAHHKVGEKISDISLQDVKVGDELIVFPHESCPVDGVVVSGHTVMDEAYLTGEPYKISKSKGSEVISGSINGDQAVTIRAIRIANDSRYARIMEVMRETEHKKVRLRRLGEVLGSWYTPLALVIAITAWIISGSSVRFLAVLVVATPCPLIIAIPVAIIGSISLAAKRAIIVKDPAVLELVDTCTTIILDKTGTLTYGQPELVEENYFSGFTKEQVFPLVANLEQYSKHPLAEAMRNATRAVNVMPLEVEHVSEPPGQGLSGKVNGREVYVTSRKSLQSLGIHQNLPEAQGLECVVIVDGKLAALYSFRDAPRDESSSFIHHLKPKHQFKKIMLVSGDRLSEVQYLAKQVGISDIHASKSPEEKVEIVRTETSKARTLFIGDGINDAPALATATVGIAFGSVSDITSEAAGVVIMDPALSKVDEFFHISIRMRHIALQSAIGGMAFSIGGMGLAAFGLITPVAGAVFQEIIDLCAVLNALRAARRPKELTDIHS